MLRHPSLHPLSHQHHNGLALGVMIRRSLEADSSAANVERQCARATTRFDHELANHFELEEEFLFPAIEREIGGHPLLETLKAEHRAMAGLAAQLKRDPAAGPLHDFLDLLRTHIRTEESILFEEIQGRLSPATLDNLGAEFRARAICLRLQP